MSVFDELGLPDPSARKVAPSSVFSELGLPDPSEDQNATPKATDYLKGIASGVGGLASGVGYLAEAAGARKVGSAIRGVGDTTQKYWQDAMTPAGKRAAESQVFEDDPGSVLPRLGDRWGQALGMGVAQSAPSMLAAAIPGGIAATGLRGIAGLAASRGIGGALAPLAAGTAAPIGGWGANLAGQVAARAPTALGFGAAEGATAGAMNAAQWKSDIEQRPEESLAAMPGYTSLAAQIGPEAARRQIAEQGAADIMRNTTLSTGAIGALTGGGALGSAFQRATTGAKGGLIGAIGRDAAKEAFQEAPQSAGERLIQNVATRDYIDPNQAISQGVLSDALSGAAIGGVMGGVTGGGSYATSGPLTKAVAAAPGAGVTPTGTPAGNPPVTGTPAGTPAGNQPQDTLNAERISPEQGTAQTPAGIASAAQFPQFTAPPQPVTGGAPLEQAPTAMPVPQATQNAPAAPGSPSPVSAADTPLPAKQAEAAGAPQQRVADLANRFEQAAQGLDDLSQFSQQEVADVRGRRAGIAAGQRTMREAKLEAADARVETARQKETEARRNAILDGVDLQGETNIVRRFEKALAQAGIAQNKATPADRERLARRVAAAEGLAQDYPPIPAAPNELLLPDRKASAASPSGRREQAIAALARQKGVRLKGTALIDAHGRKRATLTPREIEAVSGIVQIARGKDANQTEVAIPPAQGPEAAALPVAAKPAKGIAAALQYPQQVTEGGGPLAQQAADMPLGRFGEREQPIADSSTPKRLSSEEWRNEGMTPEQIVKRKADDLSDELARQIRNESDETDFDPKEIVAAAKMWAKDDGIYERVMIESLRDAINKAPTFRRKAGVLKAINQYMKKSEPTPAIPVAESIAPAPEAGDGKVAIAQRGVASELKSSRGIAGALVTPQQPTFGGAPLAQTPTALPIGEYGKAKPVAESLQDIAANADNRKLAEMAANKNPKIRAAASAEVVRRDQSGGQVGDYYKVLRESTPEQQTALRKALKLKQSANITTIADRLDGLPESERKPIFESVFRAAQAEVKSKSDGRESYVDAMAAVAKEMKIGTNADGEYDATDDQFDEMNRRTRERMTGNVPAASRQTPTAPQQVPPRIRSVVSTALDRLRSISDSLDNVVAARGNGAILAGELAGRQEEISKAKAKLAQFRTLAASKGIDADAVINELGGEPDFAKFEPRQTPAAEPRQPATPAFDSDSFDKKRNETIKASRAAGNVHLDKLQPSVEAMRGKTIFYVHNPKQRGVIRTVDNSGNVYVYWADQYSADRNSASKVEEPNKSWLKLKFPYWKSVENGKTFVFRSFLHSGDLKDYAVEKPQHPLSGAGEQQSVATLQSAYNEAKAKLDAIGPEPRKPSPDRQAFGTKGKAGAPSDEVAKYEASVKTYVSWKAKYNRLKKSEVEASNALFAAKKAEVDKAAEEFALGQAAPDPVVKKVTTEEARGQEDLRFSQESSQDNQPAFYSQLSSAIASARVTSQPAAQWKAWINGNAGNLGIKKDEIEWSGILDYLDVRGKDKVTKAEIADYLNGNGVRVEDVVKGAYDESDAEAWWNDEGGANEETPFNELSASERADAVQRYQEEVGEYSEDRDNTKFSGYWQDSYKGGIPGTYREILVRLPDDTAQKKGVSDYTVPDAHRYGNRDSDVNRLVHIRTDEVIGADGKRYLRVGEIQSDWGQKGKKEGFGTQETGEAVRGPMVQGMPAGPIPVVRVGVPAAPFVTDTRAWAALGIKRAIIHAINSGVDGVLFGTGEQNANLYDLSKQVQSIAWTGRGNDTEKTVTITVNSGNDIEFRLMPDGTTASMSGGQSGDEFAGKRLDDIVGKDVSDRIMSAPYGDMRGNGLKVGGEGMRAFYDQIIPSVANDVLKKVGGGKVGSVEVEAGESKWWRETNGYRFGPFDTKREAQGQGRLYQEAESVEQPGFAITPQMRAKIQSQGVPLFSFAGQQSAAADQFQLDHAKQLLADGANANAVRQQTGWFKGVDGKWRYEIDDSGASLKAHGFGFGELLDALGKNLTLAEVLDHPALFAAYPSIAGSSVEAIDEKSQNNGELVTNQGDGFTIRVNAGLGEAKALSVMLHEIQHGIQNVEGFASGGNPRIISAEIDDLVERKMRLSDYAGMGNESAAQELKKVEKELQSYGYDAYAAYRKLAGEVESRNVQQRQNFPADKRRLSDPLGTQDVAPEDVIVMFNGKDAKDAPAPANTTRASAMAAVGASPADAAVFDMAAEGKSAQEILSFLSKASRRPFNRVLAAALSRIGVSSTVSIDPAAGWRNNQGRNGARFAASYSPKTDTVALYTPREAERHILHELVHAATLKAIARGGPAARQMQAIFDYVQKTGTMSDQYGMGNFSRFPNETDEQFKRRALDEFTAELFSNPQFQVRLKQLPAPSGSKLKSAWDWVVRVIANMLGLRTKAQETALDRALSVGAALLQENASMTTAQGGERFSQEQPFSGREVATTPLKPGTKTLMVDGVERPALNSNGKPIHWSEEGVRNFWRWFQNSAVTDDQGRPLVLFHGATADFGENAAPVAFDFSRTADEDLSSGKGAYLTTSADAASKYSAGISWGNAGQASAPNVMPVYARIEAPFSKTATYRIEDFESVLPEGVVESAKEIARPGEEFIEETMQAIDDLNSKLAELESGFMDDETLQEYRIDENDYENDDDYQAAVEEAIEDEVKYVTRKIERYEGEIERAWSDAKKEYANARMTGAEIWDAIKKDLPEYTDWKNERQLIGGDTASIEMDTEVARILFDAFVFDGVKRTDTFPIRADHTVYIANNAPEQVKSAAGNTGAFSEDPDIRYSLATNWQQSPVAREVAKAFDLASRSDKKLSWLNPVQTQYHKAERLAADGKPLFKRVFDLGQRFLNDISRFAVMAENAAPTLFHQIKSIADVRQAAGEAIRGDFGRQRNADIRAIAAPLYEGTLYGGGNPMAGIVWNESQLRQRFGLTDRQITLYQEARDAVKVSMDEMAKSLIARHAKREKVMVDSSLSLGDVADEVSNALNLRATVFKDDAEAAHDEAMQQVKDLRDAGQDKRADADEKLADAKLESAMKEVERIGETVKDIKAIADKANKLQEAGYFPLMRFGRHKVTAKDADGKVQHFSMHDGIPLVPRSGQIEANKLADALREEHPDWTVETGLMNPEKYKLYQGMNVDALQLFADHLDEDTKQTYQEIIRLATNERSALKRMLKREGTPGFDKDVRRTLASFILSNARYTSSSYHLSDMTKAAESAEKDGGDIGAEAVKLVDYITKPQEEAAKIRGFLFFNFLGGSLAAAMVNATQIPMMTFPRLSQYEPAAKLAARLARVAKMAMLDPAKVPGDIGYALRRAEEDGITAPHQIYELTGTASNNIFAGSRGANAIMRAWGAPFALAESFNRRATFLASYEIAKAMTPAQLQAAGVTDAYEFAAKMIAETQGIYNRGNRVNVGRGALGATVMTFKQFSIMYMEMLSRMPKKQQAIMVGMLLLAAGAGGLPFADDAEDIIDTIGQWMGYRTNTKRTIRNALTGAIGQTAADVTMNGLLSRIGVDLHSRLGLHNILPGSALLKPSTTDKSREFQDLLGPAASVVASLGQAMQSIAEGKPGRAALTLAPVAIQNAVKGWRMGDTGRAEDMGGKPTIPVSASESVAKGIGFNPKAVADYGAAKRDILQDERLLDVWRERFTADIVQAVVAQDAEALQEARQAVADWNAKHPDAKIAINPASIRRRVAEMRTEGPQRVLKSLTPALRQQARRELYGAQ